MNLFDIKDDDYYFSMSLEEKIEFAKQAIIENTNENDLIEVAFSGGKDSVVLYDIAKQTGRKLLLVYNQTGIDPPEVIYFMRENYPELIVRKFEKNMFELIKQLKIMPNRFQRYCCKYLKERYSDLTNNIITGIRKMESIKRRQRDLIYKDNNFIFIRPILYFSEKDVWQYIKSRELPYCKLYNEGYKRIGCIGCPLKSRKERLRDFEKYPKFAELYKKAARYVAEVRGDNFENLWNWWLESDEANNDEEESLF